MTDTTPLRGGRQPGAAGRPAGNATTYNPITATTLPPGSPVTPSLVVDGRVVPAKASSDDTTFVVGLTASTGVAGHPVFVQYGGVLTLTTAEWDAVVTGGSDGLEFGTPYYLDSDNFAKLVNVAPSDGGTFVAPVGIALSATDMLILISFPSEN